ncbi:hypothetical protein COEREDRAFT_99739 [Coemansia reversa NRRL 1564]|uniref:Uncharacterized protein n=1 Tax=Coemansia reversa (strain ATCC 12441 / NRRL 1564) TaxID=763665 RepID=A0A2G5B2A7_COERN|nr:hypothetical protein COEREDRAFT_99739 [Coemansia reversa NRRL 1564]|eukprot:PIA13152.1 hypothetical protein COEREDRAFT_99739 [Coemansia reversa NRRL 1564]
MRSNNLSLLALLPTLVAILKFTYADSNPLNDLNQDTVSVSSNTSPSDVFIEEEVNADDEGMYPLSDLNNESIFFEETSIDFNVLINLQEQGSDDEECTDPTNPTDDDNCEEDEYLNKPDDQVTSLPYCDELDDSTSSSVDTTSELPYCDDTGVINPNDSTTDLPSGDSNNGESSSGQEGDSGIKPVPSSNVDTGTGEVDYGGWNGSSDTCEDDNGGWNSPTYEDVGAGGTDVANDTDPTYTMPPNTEPAGTDGNGDVNNTENVNSTDDANGNDGSNNTENTGDVDNTEDSGDTNDSKDPGVGDNPDADENQYMSDDAPDSAAMSYMNMRMSSNVITAIVSAIVAFTFKDFL